MLVPSWAKRRRFVGLPLIPQGGASPRGEADEVGDSLRVGRRGATKNLVETPHYKFVLLYNKFNCLHNLQNLSKINFLVKTVAKKSDRCYNVGNN